MTPIGLARAIDATIGRPAAQGPALDLDGARASAGLVADLAGRPAPAEPGR